VIDPGLPGDILYGRPFERFFLETEIQSVEYPRFFIFGHIREAFPSILIY